MLKLFKSRQAHGFTMVELVVGLGITALVMATAMPSYKTWVLNSRLRNAAESILSGIQLARMEAVTRDAPVQFALTVGSGWNVGCPTVTATCPATIQSRTQGDGSSSDVTVTVSQDLPIVFDGLGRMTLPVLAAGTSIAINVDIAPSVMPASLSRDLRIAVDAAGNARMCDPNISTAGDTRKCGS